MAIPNPIPHPSVQVVDQQGRMSVEWYEYFRTQTRMGLADLPDVSKTAPTNTQVLIYNSTTKLWTPGAN